MKTGDEWIRVKDEGELRPGMVVRETPCDCGMVHITFLVKPAKSEPCEFCGECIGWRIANPCDRGPVDGEFCLMEALHEGRLFRLAPSQLSDLSDSTTAPRELERVR